MSKSVEDRLRELEAQVRALTNLVMSDIAITTGDGARDVEGALAIAETQSDAARRDKDFLFAFHLDSMIGSIRDVRTAAASAEDDD